MNPISPSSIDDATSLSKITSHSLLIFERSSVTSTWLRNLLVPVNSSFLKILGTYSAAKLD